MKIDKKINEQKTKKKVDWRIALSCGVAALVIFLGGFYFFNNKSNLEEPKEPSVETPVKISETYLVLSINPEIMLHLDETGKVIEIFQLNDDAKIFINEDMQGLDLNAAIDKIIEVAKDKGYLQDTKELTISLVNGGNSDYLNQAIKKLEENDIKVIKSEISEERKDISDILDKDTNNQTDDSNSTTSTTTTKKKASTTGTTTTPPTTKKTTTKTTTTTKKNAVVAPGVPQIILIGVGGSPMSGAWGVGIQGVSGAEGYEIYTSTSSNEVYTLFKRAIPESVGGNISEYSDHPIVAEIYRGETRSFKVRAYKMDGQDYVYGNFSAPISKSELGLKTPKFDIDGLGGGGGTWGVLLKLNLEVDDVTGYEIYKSSSSSGTYTLITRTTDTSQSVEFHDGETAYIKIRSYVTDGEKTIYSSYSSVLDVNGSI